MRNVLHIKSLSGERVQMENMEPFPRIEMMEAYRWLSDIGFNTDRIREYILDRAGTILPVSWPTGVSIRLVDVSRFAYFLQKWSAVCNDGKTFVTRLRVNCDGV